MNRRSFVKITAIFAGIAAFASRMFGSAVASEPGTAVIDLGEGYEVTIEPLHGAVDGLHIIREVTTPAGKFEIFQPGDKIMIGGLRAFTSGG